MIVGDKIILTAIEKDDLKKLLEWRNDPDNRKYYREYRLLNYENQLAWWDDKIMKDSTWQYFSVRDKSTKELIGVTGLIYIHPVYRTAESAFEIGNKAYDTFEIAKDILQTKIKHGFMDLNLNKIWIEVIDGKPLIEVYKDLGFFVDGVMRQHYYVNGSYKDAYILSLLKEDYDKSNS